MAVLVINGIYLLFVIQILPTVLTIIYWLTSQHFSAAENVNFSNVSVTRSNFLLIFQVSSLSNKFKAYLTISPTAPFMFSKLTYLCWSKSTLYFSFRTYLILIFIISSERFNVLGNWVSVYVCCKTKSNW